MDMCMRAIRCHFTSMTCERNERRVVSGDVSVPHPYGAYTRAFLERTRSLENGTQTWQRQGMICDSISCDIM